MHSNHPTQYGYQYVKEPNMTLLCSKGKVMCETEQQQDSLFSVSVRFNTTEFKSLVVHWQLINQNQRETNPINTHELWARVHRWERQAEGEKRRLRKDSPQTSSSHFLLVEVIRIHTPDPLLCAAPPLLAPCISSKQKKQKLDRTWTPTPELKWWCSTCFLSTRVNILKKRARKREWDSTRRRGRERESSGLTAGWYSWGLAREADGAEWTSTRNFNVDAMACSFQTFYSSVYKRHTEVVNIKQHEIVPHYLISIKYHFNTLIVLHIVYFPVIQQVL